MTVQATWRSKLSALRANRPLRWLRDALLVLATLAAVSAWQTRSLPSGRIPAFTLPTLAGRSASNAQLVGSPTLLAFWAPWCGVCRAESQNLSWLKALSGARAKVMSVAVQYDRLSELNAYVAEHDVDYAVLLGGRDTARRFGVQAYPTLFFLDAKGAIKHTAVGYTTTFGLLWRLLL